MPPGGVRRSGRIPREISILLLGSDAEGRSFSEETKTLVLSLHGASILSRCKLVPEEQLFLRDLGTNKEGEVRVIGRIGERADGHVYGVAFLDSNINFWSIEFPPPAQSDREAGKVLLECSGCQTREPVHLDAIEQDVCAVNEGIVRYCKRCLLQTVWKVVHDMPASEPIVPQAAPEPRQEVPPALPARLANRRRDVRAKVNLKACIRYSGSEEVVDCEDMSRGGLCFTSRRNYPEKGMIEVAAPYSPGSQSIFVSAQIMHVHQLAQEKRFRCGAAYVKSPRDQRKF
jgi:hypothetical protein